MKKLVVDLDGTLTQANTSDYRNVLPRLDVIEHCLLYTSPSPRDPKISRMPSSA